MHKARSMFVEQSLRHRLVLITLVICTVGVAFGVGMGARSAIAEAGTPNDGTARVVVNLGTNELDLSEFGAPSDMPDWILAEDRGGDFFGYVYKGDLYGPEPVETDATGAWELPDIPAYSEAGELIGYMVPGYGAVPLDRYTRGEFGAPFALVISGE